MSFSRIDIILFFYIFTTTVSHGQENSILDDIIDQFAENADFENFEQSLGFLEDALDNPIDINKLGPEELSYFFFLSDIQQQSLLQYRERYGNFISIWELQAVPFFDKASCERLRPFLKVSESQLLSINSARKDSKSEVVFRIERDFAQRKGFKIDDEGHRPYTGDPNKIFFSLKNSVPGVYSLGLNLEKDAGEQYWWDKKNLKGVDHFSFHLEALKMKPWLERINLGDYYLNIGQGLVTYMGYSGGKSTNIAQLVKKNNLIKAFKSRSEYNYMRGLAANIKIHKKLSITPFLSSRKRDANLIIDSTANYVSSLFTSGLHRTTSEIEDAKSLRNQTLGIQASLSYEKLLFHITALQNRFSPDWKPRNRIDNQFYFSGSHMNHLTTDYRLLLKKGYLFGEAAVTNNNGWATIQGVLLNPSPLVDVALVMRYYDKKFNSFLGNPLAESSSTRNELGVFFSTNFHLPRGISFDTYVDIYQHPWYRYQIPLPTKGHEIRMKFDIFRKRKFDFYINYAFKNEENIGQLNSSKYEKISAIKTQSIRAHYSHLFLRDWEFRTRLELKSYRLLDNESIGFLAYQEFIYKPLGGRWTSSARLSYFNTDDYDSRVYAYERNINYVFSIPVFYQEGFRTYLNLRYKLPIGLTLEGRLDYILYNHQNTIGSGNQLINSNHLTSGKLQLIWRF